MLDCWESGVILEGIHWPIFSIFKASALWADAFYKPICPYVCVSVCLSVCLFTFEVPFKRLFAPNSRSQMSKNFRVLESVGKSNGKKVVSHLKFISLEVV